MPICTGGVQVAKNQQATKMPGYFIDIVRIAGLRWKKQLMIKGQFKPHHYTSIHTIDEWA